MPDKVTPDYEPHQELENDVATYLESHKFLVDSTPYHEKMKGVAPILQNLYTPTSLYLRGRADRIAVREEPPIVFEWEAKTHKEKSKHDCLLEALPLCHHLAKAQLGVKCLYVYRNPFEKHELNAGFWVSKMPPIRVIMIPGRWQEMGLEDYFKNQFRNFFPKIRTIIIPGTQGGSDDPFLIIDESDMKKLPHWEEIIKQEINPSAF